MLRYSFLLIALSFSCAHANDNGDAGSGALLQEVIHALNSHQQATNESLVSLAQAIEGLGKRVGCLERHVREVERTKTTGYVGDEYSWERERKKKKKKKRSGRRRDGQQGRTVMHRGSPTFDLESSSLTGAREDNAVLYSLMRHDT